MGLLKEELPYVPELERLTSTSNQPGPAERYTPEANSSESQKLATIRSETATLAFMMEAALVGMWSGDIQPPAISELLTLKSNLRSLEKKLAPAGEGRLKNNEYIDLYTGLVKPPTEIPFEEGDQVKAELDQDLESMVVTLDLIFNLDLKNKLKGTQRDRDGKVDRLAAYQIESALMLSRLTIEEPQMRYGGVLVKGGSPRTEEDTRTNVTQFDGIVVPNEQYAQILREYGLTQYFALKLPYSILELKSIFRVREATGKRTLRKPRIGDLNTLEKNILKCLVAFGDNFRFPNDLMLVYARGTNKFNVFPAIHLNSGYYQDWANRIEKEHPNGSGERFQYILDRLKKEAEAHRGFEQGVLEGSRDSIRENLPGNSLEQRVIFQA